MMQLTKKWTKKVHALYTLEDTVFENVENIKCLGVTFMRFQPVKCNMMQITRKRMKKIHASYTLEGTVLENVENIKYHGVTITNDLRWNTHQQCLH